MSTWESKVSFDTQDYKRLSGPFSPEAGFKDGNEPDSSHCRFPNLCKGYTTLSLPFVKVLSYWYLQKNAGVNKPHFSKKVHNSLKKKN